MERSIIRIDQDKCTGCGLCIPNCPEGAIQIIDGKARLISDLFCDGLGACIGYCPEGAIIIETREAAPYDERQVMHNIIAQGENVVKAHLQHLQEHNASEYLKVALQVLAEEGISNSLAEKAEPAHSHGHAGCPGARSMHFGHSESSHSDETGQRPSQLTHWPIQLHLLSPMAPQYHRCDLLLAADCVAYALGDFHKDYLKGRALAIACPKLDDGQEIYVDKLITLINEAKINTLTVMIMQVPCCMGLLGLARQAASHADRKVPIKSLIVGIQGEILSEEWV